VAYYPTQQVVLLAWWPNQSSGSTALHPYGPMDKYALHVYSSHVHVHARARARARARTYTVQELVVCMRA
jgi:hypothetical protein